MANRRFRERKLDEKKKQESKIPENTLPVSFPETKPSIPLAKFQTSTALLDVCHTESQLYENQCLYQKITPKRPKKNLETIYYKCKNCGLSMKIKVLFNGEVEIEFGKKHLHNYDCYVDLNTKSTANLRWNEVKARAIQLFNDSDGKRTAASIAARISREVYEIQKQNPNDIQLLVTEKTVRNWIHEVRPVSTKSIIMNNIPQDVMKPDGINEWIRLVITYPSIIILFFTNDTIRLASHTPFLLIDGTYKTRPIEFAQVLNGSGFDSHSMRYFPLFHILMKESDVDSYNKCLNEVIQFLSFDQLDKVIFDFDSALIKAIDTVFSANFSDIYLQGCFFHLVKAIKE